MCFTQKEKEKFVSYVTQTEEVEEIMVCFRSPLTIMSSFFLTLFFAIHSGDRFSSSIAKQQILTRENFLLSLFSRYESALLKKKENLFNWQQPPPTFDSDLKYYDGSRFWFNHKPVKERSWKEENIHSKTL